MASSAGGGQSNGDRSGGAMSGDATQQSAAASQAGGQSGGQNDGQNGAQSGDSALVAARQAHNEATTDSGAMGGDGRNQNAGMAGSNSQRQADATPDNSGPYGETPGEALVNDVAGLLGMDDSEEGENRGQGAAQVAPASDVAASEVAVSSLKGDAIRSRQGDKLGEIRAVVSGDEGPLLIVRTEGMILGFGSRDVEVPVSAVSLTNDGVVVDDQLAEELDAMKKAQSYRSRAMGDDDRLRINRQQ
jgi:sporulation protein YlmC with PRC-barrel domain